MASDYRKIRKDNIREYGEGTRHLEFFGKLYSDKTHFIYELLQNAEDAGATQVSFYLKPDKLELRHDGRPFDEKDVRGVCGLGEGTKADDLTQIGKFGIGFKSVYAYTLNPQIHSGDEHFQIERYVRPSEVAPINPDSPWTTLIILPFNHPDIMAQTAFLEIAQRLEHIGIRTLLFLRHIHQIEWNIEDGLSGYYLRETRELRPNVRWITVIGQKHEQEEEEDWLVFHRKKKVPGDNAEVKIEIAFRLVKEDEGGLLIIKKIEESPLVVFFPTEKETSLGFLLQGPFRTTLARDNIPKEDPWNKELIKDAAELITQALPMLRDLGYLTVSLLQALPINLDDFPADGMFFPLAEKVRQILAEKPLLPAADGSFVSASQAKLAGSAELRELLGPEQLQMLSGADQPIKWLSGEITERGTPELWKYLRQELEIEEIDAEYFARRLNEEFLKRQADEWMIRFFAYLSGQRALWRPSTSYQTAGILRNKPIIRLTDGRHVIPFYREDNREHPNAYLAAPEESEIESEFPLVKGDIAKNERALEFLKELGLPHADIVSEVIVKILPRYRTSEGQPITLQEHNRHISKILKAWDATEDSQENRDRLKAALEETPFLLSINNVTGEYAYRKPVEIYFRTSELETYFQNYNEAWFIEENNGVDLWKHLGVVDKPRFIKFKPDMSYQQKEDLRGFCGHTKDISVYDNTLDGLNNFFEQLIKVNETELQKKLAILLWNYLLNNFRGISDWKKDEYFRGEYEWFYYTNRYASFDAHWLKLIREKPWLPSPDGRIVRPGEISFDQLPPEFKRDEYLIKKIGFKLDESEEVKELAEKCGIDSEALAILKNRPDLIPELKN